MQHININDYDYTLPSDRIAKFPLPQRDQSKLLLYNNGQVSEDIFRNLATHLEAGSLMIFNNARVIQARMHFRKSTGALIEIFLLEPASPTDYEQMFQSQGSCAWHCLVGNQKKWKGGSLVRTFTINGSSVTLKAQLDEQTEKGNIVKLSWDTPHTFADIIDAVGELPIPPYLNRETQESDKTTYQTVYSKIKGSVAAPTAGLHFTDDVLRDLDQKGIQREELTLHVGAGTFRPVKSDDIAEHDMHTEHFAVTRSLLEKLIRNSANVIAVGTTTVRTLESLYYIGQLLNDHHASEEDCLTCPQWIPYDPAYNQLTSTEALERLLYYMQENNLQVLNASTQIIIVPGFQYKIVKQLVTNFHQPRSTLLLLVSAFVGGHWRTIYDYALSHHFRFLSYGDSSLLNLKC